MTSALRDAGIGIDGGYPWIVPTVPTTIPTSVSIACASLAWTARIGRPMSSKLDQKAHESAIHSMKEKQQ